MKTINKTIYFISISILGLTMNSSCSKEKVMKNSHAISEDIAQPELKGGGSNCDNNVTMNVNTCTFGSGETHIQNTGPNMVTFLNSCHTEQLEPGCQWFFQNITSQSIISYNSFFDHCLSYGTLNNHLNNLVLQAENFRPSSSYLITGYELHSVNFSTGGGWVVKIKVNYKRKICKYKKRK